MYLHKWFHENYMVLNPGACYYMTFGLSSTKNEFVLENGTIVPSAEEHVVFGITIDYSLTFHSHLKQLCKKVANNLNALTRIDPLSCIQRRLIYSSFVTGQLSYCPLIWIFCSRQSNDLTKKLQERAVRVTHNGYYSSFSELLEMSDESVIHLKNQVLYI